MKQRPEEFGSGVGERGEFGEPDEEKIPCHLRVRCTPVRLLEEGEGSVAKGKEVPQEDVKGHEFLRIDMDWGICNRGPETLMHSSLEIDARV